MHYTADSLARAAHTDLDTIRTAVAAGRLYVTTRSLPELQYDVPRPYAPRPAAESPTRSPSTRMPQIPLRRCCTCPPRPPMP